MDPLRRVGSLLVLVWCGCAKIVGVDDYSVQSSNADVSDGGPSFLPKPPTYTQPSCVDCYQQPCGEKLQACEADTFCSGYLNTVRATPSSGYPDPKLLTDMAVASWDFDQGRGGGGGKLNEVQKCARDKCRAQCELGLDFSCTGRFEWPKNYPTRSELHFYARDYWTRQGIGGLRFRACADPSLCPMPMATAMSDERGFVVATVDFALSPAVVTLPEFTGVWLVDGRSDYPPIKLQSTRPYLDKAYAVAPFFTHATAALTQVTGVTIPENSGTLLVAPYDCRDENAKGVTLEAWRPSDDGYKKCEDCSKVIYSQDENVPDTSLTEYASQGINGILYVPGSDVQDLMLVVREKATGEPISVLKRVGVRKDEFLVITMYPASGEQRADFPPAVLRP
jgi:hypothetical protein